MESAATVEPLSRHVEALPASAAFLSCLASGRARLQCMLCMLQGGALNPQMLQNMQGGGMDMDAYRQHLDQFGVTPDEVMKKILSDPELAQVATMLCYDIPHARGVCCVG